ncbi:MAG: hypothetical protein LUO89_12010 [Methanothrix sp.]|nr:hypothetical protein [Methanothrix sp.]
MPANAGGLLRSAQKFYNFQNIRRAGLAHVVFAQLAAVRALEAHRSVFGIVCGVVDPDLPAFLAVDARQVL